MKVVDSLAMRGALWAIQVLYIVRLLLTFFSPRKRDLIYFSITATSLIRIDLFLIPPGIPIPYVMFNRRVGTRVLWGVALGLIFCKRAQKGLVSAEAARAQALAGRDEAVEARALSEAAATGTLSARRGAEETLLVSRLKLEGIIHSAMESIIMVDEQQNIVRSM